MNLINVIIKKGYDKQKADVLIRSGNVFVNNEIVLMPYTKINENDEIRFKEQKKYVSRGAYKLIKAIESFNLNFNNKIILDIGSSTGGFTQVSLLNNVRKVYALDVGTNQLDYSLRKNKKVVSMEKTNLKTIDSNMFNDKIDIVVTDVSFISLKNVFEVLSRFDYKFDLIALIKPQYEVNSNQVETGGYVNVSLHKEIIDKIILIAKELGFKFIDKTKSPITGRKSKNIEYLSYFRKEN